MFWRLEIQTVLKNRYLMFAAAAVVYAGFAFYLYQPYFENFQKFDNLLPVNLLLASAGCYVITRRWVSGFVESLLAGAIYGFGPFALYLTRCHPTAGLLAASLPWLFCPAVFASKKRKWLSAMLATLPFLTIILFFYVAVHLRLFAVSIQPKFEPAHFYSLLSPLVAVKRQTPMIGFYHVPIAALVMGFALLLKARRISIMAILAISIILAFCNSLNLALGVSPVIWLTISVLCCCVAIGTGLQGFVWAGHADRWWILATAIVTGISAIMALLLATKYFQVIFGLAAGYARLFTEEAKYYLLGTCAVGLIFFMARVKLRMPRLREAILFAAIALDMFRGATFIIDRIL